MTDRVTFPPVSLADHSPTARYAISVKSLAKSYGEIEAVRGVDFEVATGEVFGFLGPNGAGKTTTINMLCTLAKPTAGSARRGRARCRARARRRAAQHRARLPGPDARRLPDRRAEPPPARRALRRSVEPGPRIACGRCSRWSGCGSAGDSPVRNFSGGMRRRLEIARGFLHSPRVLFLDEPTIGLDPQTRRLDLDVHPGAEGGRGHHDLPDHALHGRGRVVRPDRDHGPRADRRARLAGGAQGARRRRHRADPHRRRRGGDRRAGRRSSRSRPRCPKARSPSGCRPARSSCPACSPSWACRSARSASRDRRSTTSSCPTRAPRSAMPRRTAPSRRNRAMMQMMSGGRR